MAIRHDKVRIEFTKIDGDGALVYFTSMIIDVPAILEVIEGRKHPVIEELPAGTIQYSLVDENTQALDMWDTAYQSKQSKSVSIYMDESMTEALGLTYYGKQTEIQQIDVTPRCLIELRGTQGYDRDHMRIFQANGLDNLITLENEGYGWFKVVKGGNND